MKVTYTSIDGRHFKTKEECAAHEEFLASKGDLVFQAIRDHIKNKWGVEEKRRQLILEALPVIEILIRSQAMNKYPKDLIRILYIFSKFMVSIDRKGGLRLLKDIERYGSIFDRY